MFSPGPPDAALRCPLERMAIPTNFLSINVGRQAPEKRLDLLRDHLFPTPEPPSCADRRRARARRARAPFCAARPPCCPATSAVRSWWTPTAAADAFIFPSTTETFGLVALEAMACGLPVIAARTGGVLDTVVDGVNGFFYDPADSRSRCASWSTAPPRRTGAARDSWQPPQFAMRKARSWRATMDQLVEYLSHCAQRVFRLNARPKQMRIDRRGNQ
jgi:hypothetical protein